MSAKAPSVCWKCIFGFTVFCGEERLTQVTETQDVNSSIFKMLCCKFPDYFYVIGTNHERCTNLNKEQSAEKERLKNRQNQMRRRHRDVGGLDALTHEASNQLESLAAEYQKNIIDKHQGRLRFEEGKAPGEADERYVHDDLREAQMEVELEGEIQEQAFFSELQAEMYANILSEEDNSAILDDIIMMSEPLMETDLQPNVECILGYSYKPG
eukprot:m.300519 g.300519  ORF g.300519 m.300519 type:complete len:212 (-) comp16421_c1_seq42:211-846(-)